MIYALAFAFGIFGGLFGGFAGWGYWKTLGVTALAWIGLLAFLVIIGVDPFPKADADGGLALIRGCSGFSEAMPWL